MKYKICIATAVLILGCGPSEKEINLAKELAELKKQQEFIISQKEKSERDLKELRLQQERLLSEREKTQKELSDIKKLQERILFENEYNARKTAESQVKSEYLKLSGNIFIVTKGGPNIKLGLVNVSATPLNVFEEKRSSIIAAINNFCEKNQSKFNELIELYKVEKIKFDSLSSKLNQKKKQINDYVGRSGVHDGVSIISQDIMALSNPGRNNAIIYRRELNLMVAEANAIISQIEPIYKRMMEIEEKIKPISREASEISINMVRQFLGSLELNSVTALSNADGNFSLKLERNIDYILTASSNRSVGNQTEVYNWIKKLNTQTTESDISILLANDSLVESIPGDSLVREKLNQFNFFEIVLLPSRLREYNIKEL